MASAMLIRIATGQRSEEILRITEATYETGKAMVHWGETKNGLAHSVPLPRQAVEVLDSLPANRHGWFFPNGYSFGFSRLMDFAGLSSRSPLNDGWRTRPSRVQAVNSTSATSCASVHRACLASGLGTATNGEASDPMRWSFATMSGRAGLISRCRRTRIPFQVYWPTFAILSL
jgi:integrase